MARAGDRLAFGTALTLAATLLTAPAHAADLPRLLQGEWYDAGVPCSAKDSSAQGYSVTGDELVAANGSETCKVTKLQTLPPQMGSIYVGSWTVEASCSSTTYGQSTEDRTRYGSLALVKRKGVVQLRMKFSDNDRFLVFGSVPPKGETDASLQRCE